MPDPIPVMSTASSSAMPSAAPASSAAAAIPFRTDTDDGTGGVGFPVATVVCVLVLAAAIVVLRRWGPAGASPRRVRVVSVVESTRLADRTRVSVVRYRDREVVIAHSEHAIAVIAEERTTTPDITT